MRLCACWIVKNEEQTLPKSIESVAGIADGLLVVDTGSDDNTADAARGAGTRVERFQWTGDFSEARNFALDRAGGEIILFLDADEWFEPALTPADRAEMERLLRETPRAAGISLPVHNVDGNGALIGVTAATRVLRRRKDLRFRGRVHEQYVSVEGRPSDPLYTGRWKICHSGYRPEIYREKVGRNIALLESELASTQDRRKRLVCHGYLLREYHGQGDLEKALPHYRALAADPDSLRRQARELGEGMVNLLYSAMLLAADCRDRVDREEARRVVVDTVGECFPEYRGTATIGLYFDVLFGLREDELLAGAAAALAAAWQLPASANGDYAHGEARICLAAAEACLRRGRHVAAMDYAIAAYRSGKTDVARVIEILLRCTRGQPARDVAMFLNGVFDTANPDILQSLAAAALTAGLREVFVYYQKRLLDTGLATQGDYLYLLLLLEKRWEALEHALSLGEENAGAVSQHLFLRAVCDGDDAPYREHPDRLRAYSRILEAFFGGGRLAGPTPAEWDILQRCYRPAAFAAGLPAADRLRDVFTDFPAAPFRVRAEYCAGGGLCREALEDPLLPRVRDSLECGELGVACLVELGRDGEAFEWIRSLYEAGKFSGALLQFLLVTAERGTGGAGELYGRMARRLGCR